MELETVLRMLELLFQLILVTIASLALFTWKQEIRGRDKYRMGRELLEYVQGLRFLIYSPAGSMHQVCINDIFAGREKFYNDQLALIANDPIYFKPSIWGLFSQVDTRANLFLPTDVRNILGELTPAAGARVGGDKDKLTYAHVVGTASPVVAGTVEQDAESVYEIYSSKTPKPPTVKEYFAKWEELVLALKKLM